MSTENLCWISWEQHGDAEHDPNGRPVIWPPPAEVLAFWETGFGGGEGEEAWCSIVALVRAPNRSAATAIIKGAWSPGIGEWRFNREYGKGGPPGDRFPAPRWSIKLGRWPWMLQESTPMNQHQSRSEQGHRLLRRSNFEGKTIQKVDVRAVNLIRFYFTDGSSVAIEHERDGMAACDVCAEEPCP